MVRVNKSDLNIDFYQQAKNLEEELETDVIIHHRLIEIFQGVVEVLTFECASINIQRRFYNLYNRQYYFFPVIFLYPGLTLSDVVVERQEAP